MEQNKKPIISQEDRERIIEILNRPSQEPVDSFNKQKDDGVIGELKFGLGTFEQPFGLVPNYERIVFGIGIGKDCLYKTPAQAFVERLRSFEVDMTLAKTGVLDEQKTIEEHQAFLAGGYKAELREDESAEELLAEALKYSQSQQESYIAEAQKMEEGINKDEGFVSIIGKPYSDSVSRDIAASYEKVSAQVTELMNPAESQGPTE